jgi:hypothetical protein
MINNMNKQFCSYYQAYVDREHSWFVVAALKGYDHLSLDRTLNPQTSLFEFFVPPVQETLFLHVMSRLQEKMLVRDLQKLPNRLIKNAAV